MASLPSILGGEIFEGLDCGVVRTFAFVWFTLAHGASLLVALGAGANCAGDRRRGNEGRASWTLAVCSIGSLEFDLLLFELGHYFGGEDMFILFGGNVLATAPGRKKCFVGEGSLE